SRGCAVASSDADSLVKLEAAFAPPLEIGAAIFAREGYVGGRAIFRDMGAESRAKPASCRALGDDDLPGLSIAPGGCVLRQLEDARDDVVGNRLGEKASATMAIRQKPFESFDVHSYFFRFVQG